ncbi:MAG: alpha/beta fold hydrolase [Gaiellaceae bacterium]
MSTSQQLEQNRPSVSESAGQAATQGLERYRAAEQALWRYYGVQPSERFVEISSPQARLRVLEVGSGEPVLFVHGTGGTGPYWAPLVRELAGFRCLLLDRPGWGFSSPIDYTKHEYRSVVVDILSGVLGALGLERAHVVGASIGDVWALRLAQAQPASVERVVLLGGGPLLSDVPVPRIVRLIASPAGALMVRLPEKPARTRSILRAIGHGASLDAGRIPDEYVEWRATLGRETESMRSERNMIRALVRGRAFRPGLTFGEGELAAIRHPTRLVYGTEDPTGPIELWKRFVGLLPRGELRLVEGAGHLPWLDDPSSVASAVGRFLRGDERNEQDGGSKL